MFFCREVTPFFLPQEVNQPDSKVFQKYRKKIPSKLSISSVRKDSQDLILKLKNRGYQVVFDSQGLEKLQKTPVCLGCLLSRGNGQRSLLR